MSTGSSVCTPFESSKKAKLLSTVVLRGIGGRNARPTLLRLAETSSSQHQYRSLSPHPFPNHAVLPPSFRSCIPGSRTLPRRLDSIPGAPPSAQLGLTQSSRFARTPPRHQPPPRRTSPPSSSDSVSPALEASTTARWAARRRPTSPTRPRASSRRSGLPARPP